MHSFVFPSPSPSTAPCDLLSTPQRLGPELCGALPNTPAAPLPPDGRDPPAQDRLAGATVGEPACGAQPDTFACSPPRPQPQEAPGSPILGLVLPGPDGRPTKSAAAGEPPAPLRAPSYDMHLTLANEFHRAAILAGENDRLRLENSQLNAELAVCRARLEELAAYGADHRKMQSLCRHQQRRLIELEVTAARLGKILASLTSPGASRNLGADANPPAGMETVAQ